MPRFAANLSLLFTEHAFLDRFAQAARAGFAAVECQFPYAFDRQAMAEALARSGLTQVLINLPAGDWAAGERGIALLPERIPEFRDGVGRAIDYATALGCQSVNCLAGLAPEGVRAYPDWPLLRLSDLLGPDSGGTSPELKGQTFVIAGHTDARGKDEMNQDLSERRADSVKRFLVKNYDIPADNLIGVGYGKTQLKSNVPPTARENRRVQAVNLLQIKTAKR